MTGRKWRGRLLEFGEQVLAKLTKPKPQSRMARKAGPKFVQATWLGINERTGEHLVVARNGKAFRIRTVKRRSEQLRWQKEAIQAIVATPRRPDPTRAAEAEETFARRGQRQGAPAAVSEGGRVGGWSGGAERLHTRATAAYKYSENTFHRKRNGTLASFSQEKANHNLNLLCSCALSPGATAECAALRAICSIPS